MKVDLYRRSLSVVPVTFMVKCWKFSTVKHMIFKKKLKNMIDKSEKTYMLRE